MCVALRYPDMELPCTVAPIKPELEFDLRFRTGYEVSIPLKDLTGRGDLLTAVFRLTPTAHRDDPVYFSQHLRVPPIEEDAKGTAYVDGAFELGEGQYHIDFLIHNRREQICSSYWDTEAKLLARDKQLTLTLAPADLLLAHHDSKAQNWRVPPLFKES